MKEKKEVKDLQGKIDMWNKCAANYRFNTEDLTLGFFGRRPPRIAYHVFLKDDKKAMDEFLGVVKEKAPKELEGIKKFLEDGFPKEKGEKVVVGYMKDPFDLFTMPEVNFVKEYGEKEREIARMAGLPALEHESSLAEGIAGIMLGGFPL